jgi:hypothetical protein
MDLLEECQAENGCCMKVNENGPRRTEYLFDSFPRLFYVKK